MQNPSFRPLSLSASNDNDVYKTDETSTYFASSTSIVNDIRKESEYYKVSGVLNLGYNFGSAGNLGMTLSSRLVKRTTETITGSTYYLGNDISGQKETVNKSTQPFKKPSLWATLFYTLETDDRGSQLDLSMGYTKIRTISDALMEYTLDTMASEGDATMISQDSDVDNRAFEAVAKYSQAFGDGSSLDVGYEFYGTDVDYNFLRENYIGDAFVTDNDYSNNFIYEERIHSLYASYRRSWNDWFSTTIGLRAEHTSVCGDQRDSGLKTEDDYLDLFPNVSLNFNLAGGKHSISLDYNRSITRPQYSKLNPSAVWTSDNSYSQGNSEITRTNTDEIGLTYMLLSTCIIEANYSYWPDMRSDYTYVNEDNVTVTGYSNFGDYHHFSSYISWWHSYFNGWWRPRVEVTADYTRSFAQLDGMNLNYHDWYFCAFLTDSVYISKNRKHLGQP